MGVDNIEEDFDEFASAIRDHVKDINDRLEVANQFYQEDQPLSGSYFQQQVENGVSHYENLRELIDSPFYEPDSEDIELVEELASNLEKVSEYSAIEFEREE